MGHPKSTVLLCFFPPKYRPQKLKLFMDDYRSQLRMGNGLGWFSRQSDCSPALQLETYLSDLIFGVWLELDDIFMLWYFPCFFTDFKLFLLALRATLVYGTVMDEWPSVMVLFNRKCLSQTGIDCCSNSAQSLRNNHWFPTLCNEHEGFRWSPSTYYLSAAL